MQLRCCAHFLPPAKLLLLLKSLFDNCLILIPPPHLTINLPILGGNNIDIWDPLCKNPAEVIFLWIAVLYKKNHPSYGKERSVKI